MELNEGNQESRPFQYCTKLFRSFKQYNTFEWGHHLISPYFIKQIKKNIEDQSKSNDVYCSILNQISCYLMNLGNYGVVWQMRVVACYNG